MADLKPCLACGGTAKHFRVEGEGYVVKCLECHSSTECYAAKRAATLSWNTGNRIRTQLSDMTWDVLRAYASSNMNIKETGRVLYIHANSARYHLELVKKITGLNPFNFYDLVQLTEPYWAGKWLPRWEEGRKFFVCPECGNGGSPGWLLCPICGAKNGKEAYE